MEFARKFEFCCIQVVILLAGAPLRAFCEQNQTARDSLRVDAEPTTPPTLQHDEASENLTDDQMRSQYQMLIKILPGISLKFGRAKGGGGGAGGKGQVPLEVVRSIAQENETAEFDKYFYEKIKSQLNSASIHFRLFDDNPATGKTLDTSIWSDLYKTIRGMKNALKNAGMVAGSTLLVMSMKTIMAFSVKAFMAAMLSLLISALQMRKGHGHGAGYTHGSTTYEIIAKPMISHTSSIAVEPHHVEAVSEAQAGGDHYRRSQYFDALDYEPQYGVPRPVPIPVSHYSAAHGHPGSGVVYHAQVNTIN
ncbi:unnamed protein product [Bemisia tabaci]|uniref:Osiris n=1 Tax=Bemisia tabaci TaxID=7038 RepID=A0A9P0ABN6_BEMTA|nr:unnamed protein product [Bemisia tabaci]